MIRRKFRKGDYVKFDHSNGSIGKIEEKASGGDFYCRWVFGRDIHGEVMTSSVSRCGPLELLLISKKDYLKVRDSKGWTVKTPSIKGRRLPCEAYE